MRKNHMRCGNLGRFFAAWTLAGCIVGAAIFGPPLSDGNLGLEAIRNAVLSVDQEFDTFSIDDAASPPSAASLLVVIGREGDEIRRKVPTRGGAA
jgi:hypothetical protein